MNRNSHDKAGVLYKVTCTVCPWAEYWGESGFSGYTRGKEHINDIMQKRHEKSALARHLKDHHPLEEGNPSLFRFSIIKSYRKPMYRQITEGVKIHNSRADILMNRRDEWIPPAIVRLGTTAFFQ